jgi:hypothetical protein
VYTGVALVSLGAYALYMAFAMTDHQYSTSHKRWLANAAFVGVIGALCMWGGLWLLSRFFTRFERKLVISQQGISYGDTFCTWQEVSSISSTQDGEDYQLVYQTRRSSKQINIPVDMCLTEAGYEELMNSLREQVLPQNPTLMIG